MLQDDLFGTPEPEAKDAIMNKNGVFVKGLIIRRYRVDGENAFTDLRFAYHEQKWHYAFSIHLPLAGCGFFPSPKWGKCADTFDQAQRLARIESIRKLMQRWDGVSPGIKSKLVEKLQGNAYFDVTCRQ